MARASAPLVGLALLGLVAIALAGTQTSLLFALYHSCQRVQLPSLHPCAYPSTGDIYNPPFDNWWNVKTDFGAVGDGSADDTAKIQAGLDKLEQSLDSKRRVLYFPAGTYRITSYAANS